MQKTEERVFEATQRVGAWVVANATLVPSEVQPQVQAVHDAAASMVALGVRQAQAQRVIAGAHANVKDLRQELRVHHLSPLAKVARSVLTRTPELRASLRVPDRASSNEKLMRSAEAMANIGEQNQPMLVQYGVSLDFVAGLRQQAALLKQAIEIRDQSRADSVEATNDIPAVLAKARKAIQALDVAFCRVLRDDPAKLASWKNAMHVVKKGVRPDTTSLVDVAAANTTANTTAVGSQAGTAPPLAAAA